MFKVNKIELEKELLNKLRNKSSDFLNCDQGAAMPGNENETITGFFIEEKDVAGIIAPEMMKLMEMINEINYKNKCLAGEQNEGDVTFWKEEALKLHDLNKNLNSDNHQLTTNNFELLSSYMKGFDEFRNGVNKFEDYFVDELNKITQIYKDNVSGDDKQIVAIKLGEVESKFNDLMSKMALVFGKKRDKEK